MIRYRTARRLIGRADLVLAASAWGFLDADVGFPGLDRNQLTDLGDELVL